MEEILSQLLKAGNNPKIYEDEVYYKLNTRTITEYFRIIKFNNNSYYVKNKSENDDYFVIASSLQEAVNKVLSYRFNKAIDADV